MTRGHVTFVVWAALMIGGGAPLTYGQVEKGSKAPSLYQRLGGYDTLAAIFDDVAPRMAADPQFAPFFTGHSTDTQVLQRQRLLELLCQDSGGPCTYTGRPLKKAHGGLGISEPLWSTFVKYLTTTLDHLKVAEKEKGDVLLLMGRYKADIVEKP